jgi:hypothetical protein
VTYAVHTAEELEKLKPLRREFPAGAEAAATVAQPAAAAAAHKALAAAQ